MMSGAISGAARFAASVPLLLGLALLWLGITRFVDGIAVDGAIPVPNYMLQGIALPAAQYRTALASATNANPANGEAMIGAAEMAMLSGASGSSQIGRLEDALAHAPMSARGWLLLSNAKQRSDRHGAVAALAQSFVLAHFDYWIAGRRAQAAAGLLKDLDVDTHDMALRQTALLWDETMLHPQLLTLLRAPEGFRLVRNAFTFRTDELTKLSRWASSRRNSR